MWVVRAPPCQRVRRPRLRAPCQGVSATWSSHLVCRRAVRGVLSTLQTFRLGCPPERNLQFDPVSSSRELSIPLRAKLTHSPPFKEVRPPRDLSDLLHLNLPE